MTSRERIRAAINHKNHDAPPIDIGGTFATGLTAPVYARLRSLLGLPEGPLYIAEPIQMLGEVELPMIEALGLDVIGIWTESGHRHGWYDWTTPHGTHVQMPAHVDLERREDGGWNQYIGGTLAHYMARNSIYFDPVPSSQWRTFPAERYTDEVLCDLEKRARACRQNTELAVFYNSEFAVTNTNSVDFLCALLTEKHESHARLEAWSDSIVDSLKLVLDAIKGTVDIIAFSGDAGSQAAPLLSPDLYMEMIVPHLKRVTAYIHEHSDIKCFLHSCGAVGPLIDCFIAMGLDILNPIQVSAVGMEPELLVERYGGRIVFWGGGCDTQHILPHGTEDEVRQEVRGRLAQFTRVPGYVFSQVHNIQPDVSAENVAVMIDEVRNWK